MKLKHIIGILMFLLITVGTAIAPPSGGGGGNSNPVSVSDIVVLNPLQKGVPFDVSITVSNPPNKGMVQVFVDTTSATPFEAKVGDPVSVVVNTAGTHYLIAKVLDKNNNVLYTTPDPHKSITISDSGGTTGGSPSTFQISTNNLDKPGTTIDVTYDPTAKTITFVDTSNIYTDSGITWVAYNIAQAASRIEGDGHQIYPTSLDPKELWKTKNNFGAKGEFGSFLHIYGGDAGNNPKNEHRYYTVVVTVDPFKTIEPNKLGNEVGVHYVCEEFSCFVSGTKKDVEIPEFPTIALPVAAILGLMLILGRRNKE